MKRYNRAVAFFGVLIALMVCMPELHAQRRQWVREKFDWRMLEDTSRRIRVFFPVSMEKLARETIVELDSIITLYSEQLFTDSFMVTQKDKRGYTSIPKDSLKRPLQWRTGPWKPSKYVVAVLYPNPQRFIEQMIIPIIIPSNVLAFTENLTNRIAMPYSGNRHEFRQVLAHEAAHALEHFFIEEQAQVHNYADMRGDESPRLPLWSTEGFAEYGSNEVYLKHYGESENYRFARTRYRNLIVTINERLPFLEQMNTFGDFGVYTLGHEFHVFMAERFGSDWFARIRRKCAGSTLFKKAWEEVFNEPLFISEREWWKYMKQNYDAIALFGDGDSLPRSVYADKTSKGISKILSVGAIGYDAGAERMVYYEQNPKWGAIVKTYGFNDSTRPETYVDEFQIDHQFEDQSLWYRLSSPPALRDSLVAVVIPTLEHDIVRFYSLKKNGARRVREASPEGLPLVKGITFVGNDSLLLVGTDSVGQEDVYLWDYVRGSLKRLTNSETAKDDPGFVGTTLCYIESGGFQDEHRFVSIDSYGVRRVAFDSLGFVDDWVARESTIVIRSLNRNGIPDLYIWKLNDEHALRYRYGESFMTNRDSSRYARYPFVNQLVGFRRDGSVVLQESESKGLPHGQFVGVHLDSAHLTSVPVIMDYRSLRLSAMHMNLSLPVLPPDRSHLYKGFLPPNGPFGYSFLEMPKTDATGEEGLAMTAFIRSGASYHIYLGLRQFDFSHLPMSQNAIGVTIQPKLYLSDKTASGVDFIKEGLFRAERILTWPLSLENGISTLMGTGVLVQQPLDSLVRDSTRSIGRFLSKKDSLQGKFIPRPAFLTSPFIRLGVEFVSDGTFIDMYRSTRQGHYFGLSCVGMYSIGGPLFGKIINTTLSIEGKYYWRPWNSRWYVASRVGYHVSPGESPYAFFDPDLHRNPGFLGIVPSRAFGNSMLRYAVEARFPLTRMFLMDYEFIGQERPWWLFQISAAPFIYGGDVTFLGTPFRMEHRYGLAIKFGLFWWTPFNIRFEEYKTTKGKGWRPGWTLEFEY